MVSSVCYFSLEFQKSAPSINRLFSLSLHPFAIFISIFHLCSWSDNLYATWNLKPLQSSIGDCCCCFTFSTLLALQFSSRSSTISFSRSLLFFGRDDQLSARDSAIFHRNFQVWISNEKRNPVRVKFAFLCKIKLWIHNATLSTCEKIPYEIGIQNWDRIPYPNCSSVFIVLEIFEFWGLDSNEKYGGK